MTKKQKTIFLILFSIFYFLFSRSAFAAEVRIDSKTQEMKAGEQFSASVFLNTEGESINAIEGKIVFPADILELKEIRDGNSIVNFWVERPKNSGNEIIFSGIIPGGYQDTKGLIFSAVFEAKKDGASAVEIRDAKILLNDGKGTLTETKIFNFQFSIFKQALGFEPQIISSIKDTDPPENFKPEIAQNVEMFNGQWFLVFATQDKNSGIDHYEVLESRNQKIENGIWKTADSPYVLKDQELKSFIYVKAVDKAGNEKIETFLPKYLPKWYGQPLIWSIIILGIVIGCILWKIKRKK